MDVPGAWACPGAIHWSLVGSQGWLEERWSEQQEIHKRYQKLWDGEVSLFTSGVVSDTEAVPKNRLSVSCRTSQERGSFSPVTVPSPRVVQPTIFLFWPHRRSGEGLFTKVHSDKIRGNDFKQKKGRVRLDTKKKSFTS